MGEPLMRTEHTYTPAENVTEHTYIPADGESQGALWHEDVYSSEGEPGVDSNIGEEVPGTDSNDDTTYTIIDEDDTTYIIDGDGSSNPMLSTDWETLPLEEEREYLPNEIIEKEEMDYLPNETITTTVANPREVNLDEIDTGCYVYVTADFGKVQEKYREEMNFIDSELQKTAVDGDVIILSINRNMREALFDALTENRTPYVGDNAKVGALLAALPLPPTMNRTEGFSLQTVEEPFSLRFSYEMSTDLFTQEDKDMIYFNVAMLFYSIGNVDEITIVVKPPITYVQNPNETKTVQTSFCTYYMREEMEQELPELQDADYENDEVFREKLSDLHVAIEAHLAQP